MEIVKMTGDYCSFNCIHFRNNYEGEYDAEGNYSEREVSYCDLGNSEIYNRNYCENYEE